MAFITSCGGQSNSDTAKNINFEIRLPPENGLQIAEYVVEIFEDSKGNLWFGTMSRGVARYDGKNLIYFSTKDGLAGNTVASIAEDKEGNLWFGTHSGLSKYDTHLPNVGPQGGKFTNFTRKNGLCHARVSEILIDSNGNIWVGGWGGVCRYNGESFSGFPLPMPDVELPTYVETKNWVTEIIEDQEGNIWFGRSGYGACKYNPTSGEFTSFTKKDGLASNCVQSILEDQQGNIWFSSRVAENDHPDPDKRTGDGGLSKYDTNVNDHDQQGKVITQFPEIEGLSENDIYTIYEDETGDFWVGAIGVGLYRFDADSDQQMGSFTLYKETNRMDLTYGFGVQGILKDQKGTVWLGFSGGLFRLEGSSIINVTQDGPW